MSVPCRCARLRLEPLHLRRKKIALNYARRTAANPKYVEEFFNKKTNSYNTRSQGTFYEVKSSRSQRHYLSPLLSLTRDLNQYLKDNNGGL